MIKFELHLPVKSQDDSVIELLANACRAHALLSNGQLKMAITKGALWLERGKNIDRLRKVKKSLIPDDVLHFYYDEYVLSQACLAAHIIEDFIEYSVIYKPSGMPCNGSKWADHCTITRWAETQLTPQRPAFLVHRLDKAASGLLLIAHSKKAAKALSHLFEQRKITKKYQILVHGLVEENIIHTTTPINNKAASTFFSYADKSIKAMISLLNVEIETGRKHQIRLHAANLGYPVVGDRLHGNANNDTQVNLQLTAVHLSFICPLTEQVKDINLTTSLKPDLIGVAKILTS
ncbi:RluA family pseudouridine synthase [Thalassotalea sp. PP2-459]|uniref:RluA family pseudouridine synthase n=1 Tax=Thalassotalea sp. PP2-459 TaxID=1742724 RepID=UPI00094528F7|nr:RluA family pseudouridine synthase [Thalassotalea sp. PP2-459]OKY27431.1 hypothetical protein BI291_09045 [Thalassotalea sp. PP2-459]